VCMAPPRRYGVAPMQSVGEAVKIRVYSTKPAWFRHTDVFNALFWFVWCGVENSLGVKGGGGWGEGAFGGLTGGGGKGVWLQAYRDSVQLKKV
jgi:hypothetical protein